MFPCRRLRSVAAHAFQNVNVAQSSLITALCIPAAVCPRSACTPIPPLPRIPEPVSSHNTLPLSHALSSAWLLVEFSVWWHADQRGPSPTPALRTVPLRSRPRTGHPRPPSVPRTSNPNAQTSRLSPATVHLPHLPLTYRSRASGPWSEWMVALPQLHRIPDPRSDAPHVPTATYPTACRLSRRACGSGTSVPAFGGSCRQRSPASSQPSLAGIFAAIDLVAILFSCGWWAPHPRAGVSAAGLRCAFAHGLSPLHSVGTRQSKLGLVLPATPAEHRTMHSVHSVLAIARDSCAHMWYGPVARHACATGTCMTHMCLRRQCAGRREQRGWSRSQTLSRSPARSASAACLSRWSRSSAPSGSRSGAPVYMHAARCAASLHTQPHLSACTSATVSAAERRYAPDLAETCSSVWFNCCSVFGCGCWRQCWAAGPDLIEQFVLSGGNLETY